MEEKDERENAAILLVTKLTKRVIDDFNNMKVPPEIAFSVGASLLRTVVGNHRDHPLIDLALKALIDTLQKDLGKITSGDDQDLEMAVNGFNKAFH